MITLKFITLGPLLDKLGNNGKGITWNTKDEVHYLKQSHGEYKVEGVAKGRPIMDVATKWADTILSLAPETNGEVAHKSWEDQEKYKGGWVVGSNGKLKPKQGGKIKNLANIFANPNMPSIDYYYEPFTFEYKILQK